jgi:hypothetical protein
MKQLKITGLILFIATSLHSFASVDVEVKGKLATSAADTSEAVKTSDFVFVGQVVDLGIMDLRSAARHHYHDLLFEVLNPLKGNPPLWTPPKPASPELDGAADWNFIKIPPPRNGKPAVLTKTFLLVQGRTKPDDQNEEIPLIRNDYIVAGVMRDGEFAIQKLLAATTGNITIVRNLLGLESIESNSLKRSGVVLGPTPQPPLAQISPRSQPIWLWVAAAAMAAAAIGWSFRKRS